MMTKISNYFLSRKEKCKQKADDICDTESLKRGKNIEKGTVLLERVLHKNPKMQLTHDKDYLVIRPLIRSCFSLFLPIDSPYIELGVLIAYEKLTKENTIYQNI